MRQIRGRNTFDSENTIYNIGRILEALVEPKTYGQLCNALHMTDRSVRRYLSHLRAQPNRRVYLKRYLVIPNGYSPQFALGSKPDAIKPRQTETERTAKWRAKVRASPELQERQRRYDSAWWAIKKATSKPQSWASALLGASKGAHP